MKRVISVYKRFIERYTEDDEDWMYEYIAKEYNSWNLVCGSCWNLKTTHGQFMTALIITAVMATALLNTGCLSISILLAFNWKMEYGLQILVFTIGGIFAMVMFLNQFVIRRHLIRVYKQIASNFVQYDLEVQRQCSRVLVLRQKLNNIFKIVPISFTL